MLCRYLKFIPCDDKSAPYDIWVCTLGIDRDAPLDMGRVRLCTLRDMKPCLSEDGPFGTGEAIEESGG